MINQISGLVSLFYLGRMNEHRLHNHSFHTLYTQASSFIILTSKGRSYTVLHRCMYSTALYHDGHHHSLFLTRYSITKTIIDNGGCETYVLYQTLKPPPTTSMLLLHGIWPSNRRCWVSDRQVIFTVAPSPLQKMQNTHLMKAVYSKSAV